MSHKLSGRTKSVGRMWRQQYPCQTENHEELKMDTPSFSVRVEKVVSWNQRKEPKLGTQIFQKADGLPWSENPSTDDVTFGTYLGNGFVAIVVLTKQDK